MISRTLIIGTRGSTLALKQTQLVIDALMVTEPSFICTIKTITTQGDTNLSPIPQTAVGKAWFTAEIEHALAAGEIDLAVHSLKDLSPDSPKEFTTIPVTKRGDPRDVLICKGGQLFSELPAGAIIGTDSSRRSALLRHLRPDIEVKSVRGNVQTRLRKLEEENYDALVLAAAGLTRLEISERITQYFDPTTFVPAVGQGIIAAQTRASDRALTALLEKIVDPTVALSAKTEQHFSRRIGGGCKTPVGCYAFTNADTLSITGMLHSNETGRTIIESATTSKENATEAAERLADSILQKATRVS